MRLPLSSFQKTVLQWNDLHPYNAIHVVHLRATLDPDHLRRTINTVIERYGLGRMELHRDRGCLVYAGGPGDCELHVLPLGADPASLLATEIETQLNTAFPLPGPTSPFRFFAVPQRDSFDLGIVYFHAIADAESVVYLARDIVETGYPSGPAASVAPAPSLKIPRVHYPVLSWLGKLFGAPGQFRRIRTACRPPGHEPEDLSNRFLFLRLPSKDFDHLLATARAWNVTVNTLLLALLLRSLTPLAEKRLTDKRRRRITLGCVINLRKDFGIPSRSTFGVLLSSFAVAHDSPPGMSLRELARELHEQVAHVKNRRTYLGGALEMAFARFMHRLFSPARRRKFYQKYYPLWAGITNVNLNSIWPQSPTVENLDYFRAVSTGPAAPLVLSVTTVGNHMNIGFTYRPTVYPASSMHQVQNEFLRLLHTMEVTA